MSFSLFSRKQERRATQADLPVLEFFSPGSGRRMECVERSSDHAVFTCGKDRIIVVAHPISRLLFVVKPVDGGTVWLPLDIADRGHHGVVRDDVEPIICRFATSSDMVSGAWASGGAEWPCILRRDGELVFVDPSGNGGRVILRRERGTGLATLMQRGPAGQAFFPVAFDPTTLHMLALPGFEPILVLPPRPAATTPKYAQSAASYRTSPVAAGGNGRYPRF